MMELKDSPDFWHRLNLARRVMRGEEVIFPARFQVFVKHRLGERHLICECTAGQARTLDAYEGGAALAGYIALPNIEGVCQVIIKTGTHP